MLYKLRVMKNKNGLNENEFENTCDIVGKVRNCSPSNSWFRRKCPGTGSLGKVRISGIRRTQNWPGLVPIKQTSPELVLITTRRRLIQTLGRTCFGYKYRISHLNPEHGFHFSYVYFGSQAICKTRHYLFMTVISVLINLLF